jgi:hypothetical protein
MVQLRKPQVTAVRVCSRERSRHETPNRVTRPCDGCRWPDRCRHDRICWAAEKADIRVERALGRRGVETGDDPRGSNRI